MKTIGRLARRQPGLSVHRDAVPAITVLAGEQPRYQSPQPDSLLLCGTFGNVNDHDIRRTVQPPPPYAVRARR
jgi:hypothetical protein